MFLFGEVIAHTIVLLCKESNSTESISLNSYGQK